MPPIQTRKKTERKLKVEARISRSQQELLSEAAELEGRTMADFIVSAAADAARRVVRERRTFQLTGEEQATFVKAILDPPAPGARLRAAARRYRKQMEK